MVLTQFLCDSYDHNQFYVRLSEFLIFDTDSENSYSKLHQLKCRNQKNEEETRKKKHKTNSIALMTLMHFEFTKIVHVPKVAHQRERWIKREEKKNSNISMDQMYKMSINATR